jgi:hypothetical protein
MLSYFEENPLKIWTMGGVFEFVEKLYPDRERAYIAFVVQKELESVLKHDKLSHRKKAKELLESW